MSVVTNTPNACMAPTYMCVYVCIYEYVCMYVCVCVHDCMCVDVPMCMCMHVCMLVCDQMSMCTCMYACVHGCVYVCIQIWLVCVCIRVCVCVCICGTRRIWTVLAKSHGAWTYARLCVHTSIMGRCDYDCVQMSVDTRLHACVSSVCQMVCPVYNNVC